MREVRVCYVKLNPQSGKVTFWKVQNEVQPSPVGMSGPMRLPGDLLGFCGLSEQEARERALAELERLQSAKQ